MSNISNLKKATPFTKGNKFGSHRKRRVVSEAMLRDALKRSGKKALVFFEDVFTCVTEDTKNRIAAASAWSKIVFLQPSPKEDLGETVTDARLTPQQHADFDKFLVEMGVPEDNLAKEKDIMIRANEYLKNLMASQQGDSSDEVDEEETE